MPSCSPVTKYHQLGLSLPQVTPPQENLGSWTGCTACRILFSTTWLRHTEGRETRTERMMVLWLRPLCEERMYSLPSTGNSKVSWQGPDKPRVAVERTLLTDAEAAWLATEWGSAGSRPGSHTNFWGILGYVTEPLRTLYIHFYFSNVFSTFLYLLRLKWDKTVETVLTSTSRWINKVLLFITGCFKMLILTLKSK